MTGSEGGNAWDYVVVGSGAGGGTLAARLAESGMRVFLIEAGADPCEIQADRLPDDYAVPAFHAMASENAGMSWNFRVRHYADEARQRRDCKYDAAAGGVLYPRAAALGGCTAHNAMVFMLPHDSDWDYIADATGDSSWRATNMRRYLKSLEACRHRPVWRALRGLFDFTGHGWDGWLRTEKAIPHEVLADDALLSTLLSTAHSVARGLPLAVVQVLRWLFRSQGDPNVRLRGRSFTGVCYTPLSTCEARRVGTRERLLAAAAAHRDRLHIELDALATRVLFDDRGNAVGVEYLKGRRLYKAHSEPSSAPGELRSVRANREVILCGGVFNTPQLLMLSGIGPAEQLAAHKIPLRVDVPGVGRNLQDRYEVSVTYRMRRPWHVLTGAKFTRGDPAWREWHDAHDGLYTSNGSVIGIVRRSSVAGAEPDLFCMAMVARFEGYFAGYSKLIPAHRDYLTWVVLKAHTENRSGRVCLRSADPREPPSIDFHYFEEGSDAAGSDLRGVVDGVEFVRRLAKPLKEKGVIAEELAPGAAVTPEEVADFVRDRAWGHHACGSCAIGPANQGGVLDGGFRVRGVQRLRVVDASAFPRIPGIFIVSAVYLIAEKAADVILRDAHT
jgi:choline dehydrogenase